MNLLQEWIKRTLAVTSNSSVLEYISEVNADDYVLVHFRFALCKVDEEDAAGIYWLLKKWIGWQSGRPRQSELRRED